MNLNQHRIGAYLKGSGKPAEEPAIPASAVTKPAAAEPATRASSSARGAASTSVSSSAKSSDKSKAGGLTKVVGSPQKGDKPSRAEIARYLVLIGQEEASNILRHLNQDEVEAIAQEIAKIQSIGPDEARQVLARFTGLVKTGLAGVGGLDTARTMLFNAFGEEKGGRLLRQALPEAEEQPFQFMRELENGQVAALLKPESVAVKGNVLASLPSAQAAAVLKELSREEQKQLVIRMSRMQKVERDVLVRIDAGLKDRLRTQGQVMSDQMDGTSNLAAIMRHLDPDLEQRLLDHLQDEAPDVADTIKEHLFTIDTILLIDDREFQKVLQPLDAKYIALILKGKNEAIRKKFLANVSENRSAQILDDYLIMGPKPKREVDEATREFIARLRQMAQDGEIVVRRDDELYV